MKQGKGVRKMLLPANDVQPAVILVSCHIVLGIEDCFHNEITAVPPQKPADGKDLVATGIGASLPKPARMRARIVDSSRQSTCKAP